MLTGIALVETQSSTRDIHASEVAVPQADGRYMLKHLETKKQFSNIWTRFFTFGTDRYLKYGLSTCIDDFAIRTHN